MDETRTLSLSTTSGGFHCDSWAARTVQKVASNLTCSQPEGPLSWLELDLVSNPSSQLWAQEETTGPQESEDSQEEEHFYEEIMELKRQVIAARPMADYGGFGKVC